MSDFSLEIPHLTYYLKRILDRYPLGGQILKELLQNAEDSGASIVKFYIDYTEYPSDNILHPDLKKFQGPSLLAYNDSQFDENDFKSIKSIEKSQKFDKPLKIGKFGLGFNSIYHLTDLPSVVSGYNMVIFDPHERYFAQHNARRGIIFNYKDQSFHDSYYTNFTDQFEPYRNVKIDNNETRIDFKNEFKGTLFRFPIRNKEAAQVSKLCSEFKEFDKIINENVFDSFFKDLNLILLFLRKIETIEIYEIKNGKQTLVASTSINFDKSSDNLRNIRKEFMDRLINTLELDKTMKNEIFEHEDIIYNYKLFIETKLIDKNSGIYKIKDDKYLISSFVKLKSASKELQNLAFKTATFPACGVAYNLNDKNDFETNFKTSRYFCFLPMPETIEKSGLPFHIHGTFGLRDDRRDFRWPSQDNKEDESAKWNELMVNEVLNKVCLQLIDFSKNLINSNDNDFNIVNFYNLLPNLENTDSNWKEKHLKTFLNNLSETDLVLNRCLQWSNLNEIYLTNKMDEEIDQYLIENDLDPSSNFKEIIYKCFDQSKLSMIPVPKHVLEIFKSNNQIQTLKYIDNVYILNLLRDISKFNCNLLSNLQKTSLLNFLLQSVNSLNDLNDIQLLPLKYGTWTFFNSEQRIYYFENNDEKNLFENKIGCLIFDDQKLNKKSMYKLLNELLNPCDNRIVKFDKNHFPILYTASLKNDKKIENLEWCKSIWKFISINYYDSLTCLENLPLLPYFDETSNSYYLFPLNQSNKLIKYFTIQHKSDSSNKLADFFEKHSRFGNFSDGIYGCLFFKNLPESITNNPKINNYIRYYDSNSILDMLHVLDKCLIMNTKSLRNLIDHNMNSNSKAILIEELDSIRNILSQESLNLLAQKIPIFKVLNKKDYFLTALECDFKKLNTNFDIMHLPLDPSLNIIDTRNCEMLAKNLNFKNYPIELLFEKSIDYHANNKDIESLNTLLEWLMMNRFRVTEKGLKLETFIKNKLILRPIFRDSAIDSINLKCLNEIYDPNDKFVQVFIPKTLHLADDFMNDLFYPTLQPYLLKTITIDHFEYFVRKLNNNNQKLSKNEFYKNCNLIFEYVKTLNMYDKDKLLKLTLNYNWLPCENEFTKSDEQWKKTKLFKSSELWDNKFRNLIGYVKPLYDSNLIPIDFKKALQINSNNIDLVDVLSNLDYFIKNNSASDIIILDDIYQFLQNFFINSSNKSEFLKNELKLFFQSKPFVYDGVSKFCDPLKVISDSEISDLSPYYTVLNKNNQFLIKYKLLYSEVFEIKNKLTLEILLEILTNISNLKTNEFRKQSILLLSIYDLIENKFLEDLTSNSELLSKFILPVLSVNNNLEFEIIENCVYLVENDLTDEKNLLSRSDQDNILKEKITEIGEKGLKICDPKINNRFLRKIGVNLSTVKLMGIENMNMESFGQSEKLTDRIKKLLDGYKDGISIFKEAIQNADDAGATIVKICYDKRTNEQWKNPIKMLDRGLVNCQGPSLVLYNDAVFTDIDFTNLTKLGAGTKKDSKDKVGKFGLGFNAFYNVTDLPCILSRDTFVMFDPNIKFMKNIIENVSQPGVKLNLRSLNKSVLQNYRDQFKPYENLFGCEIFKENFFYNGSLIRLPLRSEPSEISSHVYNNDYEIESLLEILINNADSILLFTQSVKAVEFYVIPSEADNAEANLLIKIEKSPELYLEKHNRLISLYKDEFTNETSILKACSSIKTNDILKSVVYNKK